MATATSTTTMPTSRGVKSSFGGLPPIAIFSSRAYPAARPETTALWYSALTSIFPSVAGVVMVLFHIVAVAASLQLGRFIMDFGRRACPTDVGLGWHFLCCGCCHEGSHHRLSWGQTTVSTCSTRFLPDWRLPGPGLLRPFLRRGDVYCRAMPQSTSLPRPIW